SSASRSKASTRPSSSLAIRIWPASLLHRHLPNQISSLEPRQHLLAGNDPAEHGVTSVEIRPIGQRDVHLAVGQRRIPWMRERDGPAGVRMLLRDLGRADRLAAGRAGATTPFRLERQVARSRVAPLHHETRERAMDALSVVETTRHELDDVRDRFRCVVRIRFELERALRSLHDDHGAQRLRPQANTQTTENTERTEKKALR